MGEYQFNSPMLGLICDGTGYGEDGKIWGFEFIFGNAQGYERRGHLEYLPLPGGDAGAKHPLRIAYAYLKKSFSDEKWNATASLWEKLSLQERVILDGQIKSGFQMFDTSSAGRFFDAISGLLGVCTKVTYEGQAAIELESVATLWFKGTENRTSASENRTNISMENLEYEKEKNIIRGVKNAALCRLVKTNELLVDFEISPGFFDENQLKLVERYNYLTKELSAGELYPIWLEVKEGMIIAKLDLLLGEVARDYLQAKPIGEIAFRFHYSLAISMLETAMIIGIKNNTMIIGGGVFQNKLLTETLIFLAQKVGVQIYFPTQLPLGDGGLALGQVLIANKMKSVD
jgi:hydrogenase maturation protein HypF